MSPLESLSKADLPSAVRETLIEDASLRPTYGVIHAETHLSASTTVLTHFSTSAIGKGENRNLVQRL